MPQPTEGEIVASSDYIRNCLSGPTSLYARKVKISRITGEEVELTVPGEQTLSNKTLRTVAKWFKEDPEHTNVVVLFDRPFMFVPSEVTTGSEMLDGQLTENISYGAASVIASMAFRVASRAKVTRKGSTISLSTGWIHVNGEFTADIIPPTPMPNITITSKGSITFE